MNKQYQLQRSTNPLFWENTGALFEGSGDPARFLFSASTPEPTFYRLKPE